MTQYTPIALPPAAPSLVSGVFETLLVRDGNPVELDRHLARLSASVATLYERELSGNTREQVMAEARGFALARLRLSVAPDAVGELTSQIRVRAVEAEMVFPRWERAVAVSPFVVPGGIGEHKWADRACLEQAEGISGDVVPLILEPDGAVLEASRANVFIVRGGTVLTPQTDGRLLPGVTRARVIELSGRFEPVREWREGAELVASLAPSRAFGGRRIELSSSRAQGLEPQTSALPCGDETRTGSPGRSALTPLASGRAPSGCWTAPASV